MKCPGQDPRCWSGNMATEVPCPECGSLVEFFKDEGSGRCRRCGHRFLNPGVDFGCAQWCSVAEQCIGIAPARSSAAAPSGDGALAARLIQAIEEQTRQEPSRLARALRAFQCAKELVASEGGEPRIILAAALLLGAGASAPSGTPLAEEAVLLQAVPDEVTRARICRIIAACRRNEALDVPEFKIVWDACRLAAMAEQSNWPVAGGGAESGEARTLWTESARRKASSRLPGPTPPGAKSEGGSAPS